MSTKTTRFIARSLQHAFKCSVACSIATAGLAIFLAQTLTQRQTVALILMSLGLTGLIWTAARAGQRHLTQSLDKVATERQMEPGEAVTETASFPMQAER